MPSLPKSGNVRSGEHGSDREKPARPEGHAGLGPQRSEAGRYMAAL